MSSSVSPLDILIALEPTGFSSPDSSLVLGLVASGFILTMAGLFGYAYKELVLEYRKREQELNTLLSSLESPANQSVSNKDIWDNDIAPKLQAISWLAPSWTAYRSQCWEKGDSISSLANAEQYFPSIAPDPKGFSSQVSGILTSIGILGTFIGITVGLGKIAGDMGAGSSSEMQNAMSSLIASLGVSFRTSIWGLISSMTITALSNKEKSRLENQRTRLIAWLNQTMPQRSERALLAEQTVLAEQQLQATENMGASIAKSITESINGPNGLKGAIDKMVDSIAASQTEGLDRLVQEFMKQMQTSMNADFSQLGTALRDMVNSNNEFQLSMSKLLEHLQGATNNQGAAAEKMQEALKNAALSISEMKGSLSGLSSVSGNIQDAAMAMQKVLEQQMNASANQQNTISNLMDGIQEQSNGMLANQEEITKAGNLMAEKFSSLGTALQDLIVWHNRVKDSLNTQIASFMSTIDAQQTILDKMGDERKSALEIVRRLGTTQANLGPAATSIAGAGEAVKKASDSLFSTEKSLRSLTTGLQDAANELNDRQIQALDQYQDIQKSLRKILSK